MALLGTLIDRSTVSQAPGDDCGVIFMTVQHSLPNTSPDSVIPVMRSLQAVGASGNHNGLPALLGLGGNASISTVAYVLASNVSAPVCMFDVLSIVFHSVIR